MFKIILASLFLIGSVYGHGQLILRQYPPSLKFKGQDPLKESELPDVYSACLGFSINHESDWDALHIEDPFNLAEMIVTVAVEGLSSINYVKGHHYPLRTDTDEAEVYQTLERRIRDRRPESHDNLVRVDLSNGLQDLQSTIFKDVKSDKPQKGAYIHLSPSVDEDREFLKEIELLNAITNEVEKNGNIKSNNIPAVLWLKFNSLHALVHFYGENSTHTKEAEHILIEAIERLNSVLDKKFNKKYLLNVIVSDSVHTRRGRSILEGDDDNKDKYANLNLASNYDENYPAVFNIILWFGVAMFFSLLAICYAIGTMDPGRDSIIYRMTSTRMKKDN